MQQLSVIARDLEKYNKNRNFDMRARSMQLSEEKASAEMNRNYRSIEPPSAKLRVGYEVDILSMQDA